MPVETNVTPCPLPVPEVSSDLQTGVPDNVTVGCPELLSKITGIPDVGAKIPPTPPEVAAQLVDVVASQVPVAPTQYNALLNVHPVLPLVLVPTKS